MKIIPTADGSHTLFSEQFKEIYHSQHGALQESQHVFIKNGLDYIASSGQNEIGIFEVGFGTGLNALLTLIEAEKKNLKIHYETIELYPVPLEIIKELNYPSLLENDKYRPPFHSMHLCTWNEEHRVKTNFYFQKVQGSVINCQLLTAPCQVIYFDAFAPEYQPEMWSHEVMKKMYEMLAPKGVLVSYCSKSSFQHALKEAGFNIEKLPGPPGKREMLRAHKI